MNAVQEKLDSLVFRQSGVYQYKEPQEGDLRENVLMK